MQVFKVTIQFEGKEVSYTMDISDEIAKRVAPKQYISPDLTDHLRIELLEALYLIYGKGSEEC